MGLSSLQVEPTLVTVSDRNLEETDLAMPTMWYDPEGRVPDMYTPVTYEEIEVELQSQPVASQGDLIYVLVNSTIYNKIKSSVSQYARDLGDEGYSVSTYTISGGTAEEIRSFLASAVPDGLNGVLFVGDIPEAWYEMNSSWGYEEFPVDLFYMDLDGTWADSDGDGLYDLHEDDVEPEIYVGRLKASNIEGDEVSMIKDYFEKIHTYRTGGLSLPKRALVYVDDDWIWWADEDNAALKKIYDETTLVKRRATTNATDYKQRITQGKGYEWVHLRCHGHPNGHTFKVPENVWDGSVSSGDYLTMNPKVIFYHLFVCSAARYTSTNNLAGTIVFTTSYGVLVVGSTKAGGMLYFYDFYGPVAARESIGMAFQKWFIRNGEVDRKWFYGLTIIGDPTLRIRERDIAVTNVTTCKTIVGQGYIVHVNVTVENQGAVTETFNVTAYYDDIPIETKTVANLQSGEETTVTFTWNTTGVAYGYYTISAVADTFPGETDISDNTLDDGVVTVTIPGDVNGDGYVNSLDYGEINAHWWPGPPPGSEGYDPNVDINHDGRIDAFEINIVVLHWGQSW